jgi:hypothetical protein
MMAGYVYRPSNSDNASFERYAFLPTRLRSIALTLQGIGGLATSNGCLCAGTAPVLISPMAVRLCERFLERIQEPLGPALLLLMPVPLEACDGGL